MTTNTCRGPQCNRPVLIKSAGLCKSHYQQQWAGRPLTVLRKRTLRKQAPPGYLHCTKCDTFKTEDNFYIRNTGKPQQHCKACMIADARQDLLLRRARRAVEASQSPSDA